MGGHSTRPGGACPTPSDAQPPPGGALSRTQTRRLGRTARLARLREQLAEACARTGQPGGPQTGDPRASSATPPSPAAGMDEAPLFVRLRPITKGSLVPAGPPRPASPTLVSKFGSPAGATSRPTTLVPLPHAPPARSPPTSRAMDPALRSEARATAKPRASDHAPYRATDAPRAFSRALVTKAAFARYTAPAPPATAPLPGPPPRPNAEEPGPPPVPRLEAEPYPANLSCPCSLCWWARRAATLSTAHNGTAGPTPHKGDQTRSARGRAGEVTGPALTRPRL